MSDGITLNLGTGGKELETTELANGRQVQKLQLVLTFASEGGTIARPVSEADPLPCIVVE